MLSQRQYNQLAEEFQTNIGIAEWSEPFYGYHTNIRKMPDDLKVAILTGWIIKQNIYQQVHRELYRLQSKYKNKRIKELTLYEKAIDIVAEKNGIIIE